MKNFLIFWIIIQLITMNIVTTVTHDKLINKTYDCKDETFGLTGYAIAVAFPLLPLTQEDSSITRLKKEFCKK